MSIAPTVVWLSFAVALLAMVGTWLVRRVTVRHQLLDVPNERSAHKAPTPTSAGLAIVLSFALGVMALEVVAGGSGLGRYWAPLLVSSCIVGALGLLDDLRALSARLRLLVQMLAALLFCLWALPLRTLALPGLGAFDLGPLAYPLSVLWLVALTNFYNFMDGIDGIAAGTAILVCVFLAVAFGTAGGSPAVPILLAAGCLGFLTHNYPPAKIFMGDVGSGFLGFVLGALAILGNEQLQVPLVASGLALAMFILDTTVTLVRRIMRGERWYAAHRSHLYQRLVHAGWTHSRVDYLEFGLTGLFCLAGYAYLVAEQSWEQVLALCTVVGLFGGFALMVRRVGA